MLLYSSFMLVYRKEESGSSCFSFQPSLSVSDPECLWISRVCIVLLVSRVGVTSLVLSCQLSRSWYHVVPRVATC